VVVTTLLTLCASARSVEAVDYDFVSLSSGAQALAEFAATAPSVNNAGVVAFAALAADPTPGRNAYVLFRSEGAQLVPLLNLSEALGVGHPTAVVINDAGAIVVNYALATESVIVRRDADGAILVLARADQPGSAPYLDFAPTVSMNAAGQVAVRATNLDLTSSVVRLDESGAVEIARSATALVDAPHHQRLRRGRLHGSRAPVR
jgi:hypothetical protein